MSVSIVVAVSVALVSAGEETLLESQASVPMNSPKPRTSRNPSRRHTSVLVIACTVGLAVVALGHVITADVESKQRPSRIEVFVYSICRIVRPQGFVFGRLIL